MRNYYKVLEVSENASSEQIKKAYFDLVKRWHPDRNPYDSLSQEMMKMYNEAYEVLSDPQKKHAYDESIGIRQPKTDQYHNEDVHKPGNTSANTNMDMSGYEYLFKDKVFTKSGFDKRLSGIFLSRLSGPAYRSWGLLVATIFSFFFVYLSITYQEAFVTPLFILVAGVVLFLVVFSIVKITRIVLEVIREDKRNSEWTEK